MSEHLIGLLESFTIAFLLSFQFPCNKNKPTLLLSFTMIKIKLRPTEPSPASRASLYRFVSEHFVIIFLNILRLNSVCPKGKYSLKTASIRTLAISTKSYLFNPQVNNVSKMAGPIGPPGFNGSQGPAGPSGAIGPPGPQGSGNFSACQYKVQTKKLTPGNTKILSTKTEPDVSML